MEQKRSGLDKSRDIDCPVCGTRMRAEDVDRISILVCDEHGVWLDKGDLELIKLNTNAKNVRRIRRLKRELEDAKDRDRSPEAFEAILNLFRSKKRKKRR